MYMDAYMSTGKYLVGGTRTLDELYKGYQQCMTLIISLWLSCSQTQTLTLQNIMSTLQQMAQVS